MAHNWLLLHRGAEAADALLKAVALERVAKAPDPLEEQGFIRIAARIAGELADATADAQARAMQEALDALDVNWPSLTPEARDRAIAQATKIIADVGPAVAPTLSDVLQARGSEVVASTKGAMIDRYELPIAARLTQVDDRVIAHAASSQALYVRDQYGRRSLTIAQQARAIHEAGARQGLGRSEIAAEMEAMLGTQLGRNRAYFETVASIFLGRSRSYGQLVSMDEAEIEEWEFSAVMDEVTCFAPGSRVLMADGSWRPIEAIASEELVTSCTGRARRVIQRVEKTGRRWGTLTVEGIERALIVTHNHGMLTTKGWIRAGSLQVGDQLVLYKAEGPGAAPALWGDERSWGGRNGRHDGRAINVFPWPTPRLAQVAAVAQLREMSWSGIDRRTPAYDLEVEHDAGYVVEGVIVHNSPVCRMMDGRRFSTKGALSRYQQVAASEDPEAVVQLQPFVQMGRDADGNEVLYYRQGEQRVTIARVEDSGLGRLNDRGKFSNVAAAPTLEAAGITAPPLHGRCRSALIPA